MTIQVSAVLQFTATDTDNGTASGVSIPFEADSLRTLALQIALFADDIALSSEPSEEDMQRVIFHIRKNGRTV
jgi:hypothetical protein